jgi:hypothetical protein
VKFQSVNLYIVSERKRKRGKSEERKKERKKESNTL